MRRTNLTEVTASLGHWVREWRGLTWKTGPAGKLANYWTRFCIFGSRFHFHLHQNLGKISKTVPVIENFHFFFNPICVIDWRTTDRRTMQSTWLSMAWPSPWCKGELLGCCLLEVRPYVGMGQEQCSPQNISSRCKSNSASPGLGCRSAPRNPIYLPEENFQSIFRCIRFVRRFWVVQFKLGSTARRMQAYNAEYPVLTWRKVSGGRWIRI